MYVIVYGHSLVMVFVITFLQLREQSQTLFAVNDVYSFIFQNLI